MLLMKQSPYSKAIDEPFGIHRIKFKPNWVKCKALHSMDAVFLTLFFALQHLPHKHEATSYSQNIPYTLVFHDSVPCTCRSLSLAWAPFPSHAGEFTFNLLRSNSNIAFLNYISLFKHFYYYPYHTVLELLLYKSISFTRLHAVVGINCPTTYHGP